MKTMRPSCPFRLCFCLSLIGATGFTAAWAASNPGAPKANDADPAKKYKDLKTGLMESKIDGTTQVPVPVWWAGYQLKPLAAEMALRYSLYVPEIRDVKEKFPLLVSLHGSGDTQAPYLNMWKGRCEKKRWMLLAPKSIGPTWGLPCMHRLSQLIGELKAKYPVDPDKVFIHGYSDGGKMGLLLVTVTPKLFAAAACIHGITSPEIGNQQGGHREKGFRVFACGGGKDPFFPLAMVKQTCAALEKLGVTVKLVERPDAGHSYPSELNDSILEFMAGKMAKTDEAKKDDKKPKAGDAKPDAQVKVPEAKDWTPLNLSEAAAHQQCNSVYFVDALNGWIVGNKGLCLTTKDGGKTWSKQETGSQASLNCVRFNNANTGFITGHDDPAAPRPTGRAHVVMGRPLAAGAFLATTDGGKSWKRTWLPTNFDVFNLEASASPVLHIVTCGGADHMDGDILRSEDNGETWKIVRCFRGLFDIRAAGDRRWIAVGSRVLVGFRPAPADPAYTNQECRIVFSKDGGKSVSVSKGSEPKELQHCLSGLAVKKGLPALAVGDNGTILSSNDQGESWQPVESGTREQLKSVAWSSGTAPRAVAVGSSGTIATSVDGKVWKTASTGKNVVLFSVASAGDAFVAVGANTEDLTKGVVHGVGFRAPAEKLK
jgi:photosystem II stability/assembly factor-like uncharacterized protein